MKIRFFSIILTVLFLNFIFIAAAEFVENPYWRWQNENWQWQNEPSTWDIGTTLENFLHIEGETHRNLWASDTTHFLYQEITADEFDAETHFFTNWNAASAINGLIVKSPSDNNWVTLKFWARDAAAKGQIQFQTKAFNAVGQVPGFTPTYGNTELFFRLRKIGNTYTAWYKTSEPDGWIEIGTTNISLTPPLHLGVYAGIPAGSGTLTVNYEYFTEYFGIQPSSPSPPIQARRRLAPTGTTPGIHSLAVSPDGSIIATGDAENNIRLWDASAGTISRTLTGHGDVNQNDVVRSLAFSPDGTKLVSGGGLDGTVRLWNTSTGEQIRTIETPDPTVVAFSPDGTKVVNGSHHSPYLRMWDANTGQLFRTLAGHTGTVYDLAVSPGTGNKLASAGADGSIRIWDANTGNPLHTFAGHNRGVTSIEFLHPNGSIMVSAGNDSTLRWWGTRSKRLARTRGYTGSIQGVRVSPNFNIMVSGSLGAPHKIQVWDASSSTFQRSFAAHTSAITGVAITSDSSTVVTASLDGTVLLWNVADLLSPAAPQLVSRFGEQRVGMGNSEPIVKTTALLANYPNPFNPETWIPYQLAAPADVSISIYSAGGSLVRTLSLGTQDAGVYASRARAAYWDGHNQAGEAVASGIYFYTLKAGEFRATRRMLILK